MAALRRFLFEPIQEEDGNTLPFARWDVLLAVALGIALMFAAAYSETPGGWTITRSLIIGATIAFAVLTARRKRAVVGGALVLLATRLGLALPGEHRLVGLAVMAGAGVGAWVLLKNLK